MICSYRHKTADVRTLELPSFLSVLPRSNL